MPNILILYGTKETTPYLEFVSEQQVAGMEACLHGGRWQVTSTRYSPATVEEVVLKAGPELVFNLVYGYRNSAGKVLEFQPDTARRLETLGVTTVGSDSAVQTLCQDKAEIVPFLFRHGIQSPRMIDPSFWRGDGNLAVAKPRYGACHRGVTLVRHLGEWAKVSSTGEPYILQEYVSGEEYTVGVIERGGAIYALPPIQAVFDCPPGKPRLMVWPNYQFSFQPDLKDRFDLRPVAASAFRALGLRDYARFDFRMTDNGPVLLDANALPNLDPKVSLLPLAARADGLSYCELVATIAESAARRLP